MEKTKLVPHGTHHEEMKMISLQLTTLCPRRTCVLGTALLDLSKARTFTGASSYRDVLKFSNVLALFKGVKQP